MDRRQWLNVTGAHLGAFCLAAGLQTPALRAEEGNYNEHPVEPRDHREDKADIWTLHFSFKSPRIITADVPARGQKVIWYMWYQVYNRTAEQVNFYPDFELVTLDKSTVHMDEVLPSVEDLIKKQEDPNNRFNILNSVTIGKDPIPVTKKDSYPRAVTGVAIWSDVYDRARDTNRFSIFVTGLSNGWTEVDKVIRRKTLQLNFQKLGDDRQTDIRWTENPEWVYRATGKVTRDEKK